VIEVLAATIVKWMNKTFIILNFDTNIKANTTGKWIRRGYSFIKNVYLKFNKTKITQISIINPNRPNR